MSDLASWARGKVAASPYQTFGGACCLVKLVACALAPPALPCLLTRHTATPSSAVVWGGVIASVMVYYSRSKIPFTLQVYQARMVAQGSVVLGLFAWCASASLTPKPSPDKYNVYRTIRLENEAAAAAAAAAAGGVAAVNELH